MDVPIANLRRGNVVLWQERPACVRAVIPFSQTLVALRLVLVVGGDGAYHGKEEEAFQTRPIAASLTVKWLSRKAKVRYRS